MTTRTRRRIAASSTAIALGFATLALATTPAASQVSSSCPVSRDDQIVDAEEQALLGLINDYRRANAKAPLTMHPGVTRAAAWFSRDMATKNYFPYNHVDSLGRNPGQRLSWCGVNYSNYAENIYAGRPDAQSVFNAWRASSGHNANMLRDGVTAAGIARAYQAGSTYSWYWTLDVTNSAAPSTTTTVAPTTTTSVVPATTTTTAPMTTTTALPTTTTSVDWRSQYDALIARYRAGR